MEHAIEQLLPLTIVDPHVLEPPFGTELLIGALHDGSGRVMLQRLISMLEPSVVQFMPPLNGTRLLHARVRFLVPANTCAGYCGAAHSMLLVQGLQSDQSLKP